MDEVKKLRDETGQPVMQCKKALEEAEGDPEKAKTVLSKKGREVADKKAERELGAGAVRAYVHNSYEVGAMVLLSCETDFVARNEEFSQLAYDIAMQVAATNPWVLKREEISESQKEGIKSLFAEEMQDKPKEVQEKAIEGKMDSYLKEKVLLEQEFIKDSSSTITDLINSATQKFGERIEISEFKRISVH